MAIDGIACSDGNACTGGDACNGGACAGTTISCDDDNACTTDACDTKVGCTHTVKTGSGCNDGNACSSGDACDAKGKCIGSKVDCNDDNVCTLDLCDVDSGCYATKLEGAACDDGKLCTVGDSCANGVCGGAPKDCDDGNECTTDACDSKAGCTHTPASKPCNDGDECTTGDTCVQGKCLGATKNCSDGNACTKETCHKLLGCQYSFTAAGSECTDADSCTQDACDGFGGCDSTPLLGSRSFPVGYEARDVFVGGEGTAIVVGRSDTSANGAFVSRIPWIGKQPPMLFRQKIRSYDRIVPMPDGNGGTAGLYLLGRGELGGSGNPLQPSGSATVDYLGTGESKIAGIEIPLDPKIAGVAPVDHFSHGFAIPGRLLVGSARMGFEAGRNGVFLGWAPVASKQAFLAFWHPTTLLGMDTVVLRGVHVTSKELRHALVVYSDRFSTRMVLLRWNADNSFSTEEIWGLGIHPDGADAIAQACHLVDRLDGGFEVVLPGKNGSNKAVHVRRYDADGAFVAATKFTVDAYFARVARRGAQYIAIDEDLGFHVLRRAVTAPQASRTLLGMPTAMTFGPKRDVFFLQHQVLGGLAYDTLERRDPWAAQQCSACMTDHAAGCGSECKADDCNSASGFCVGGSSASYCDDGNPCTTESCVNGSCASEPVAVGSNTGCFVSTSYCTGASGACSKEGVCVGQLGTPGTCVEQDGDCQERRCVDGSGCVSGPLGAGGVCKVASTPATQSYCGATSAAFCQVPGKIVVYDDKGKVLGNKKTVDLPAVGAGLTGNLLWMRMSITLILDGEPFAASEQFGGIEMVRDLATGDTVRLVPTQAECRDNGSSRDCFPFGQNTATFTLPDVTRFQAGAGTITELLAKPIPKGGFAVRVNADGYVQVKSWTIELGMSQ